MTIDEALRFYYDRLHLDVARVLGPPRAGDRVVYNEWDAPTGRAPFWPNLPAYWGR